MKKNWRIPHMLKKVTNTIYYVGANDHDVDLFEG